MSCKSEYTYTVQTITNAVKLQREYSDCRHRVMMATVFPEIEPNVYQQHVVLPRVMEHA